MESQIQSPIGELRSTPGFYTRQEIEQSRIWCREIARRAAKNFYYSFLALSGEKFHGMCALYAFMRVTDDLGDDPLRTPEERKSALKQWREELNLLGKVRNLTHPAWPAVWDMQARFGISKSHLETVIDGVESDLHPVEMRTFADLEQYCYRVAGVVGFSCLRIWGTNDPQADELAVDCGLAFQLTNILRDLKEDLDLGRVYLPTEDFQRFGYSPAELAEGKRSENFRELMAFETGRTRKYYTSAESLEQYLTDDAKPVLRTMLRIYRGILEEIARRDYDVFSGRVRLSTWAKSQIVMSELVRSRWRW